jgi:release factor glutamine methyltransferase
VNIAKTIQTAAATLAAVGVESARVEAEWLMAHVLGCRRPELGLRRNEMLAQPQVDQWHLLIARRAERIPLQHLLGTADFCGLEMTVNENVLVPRPETELLAEAAWQFAGSVERPTVLDFGTGSGCLAIAIATNCPGAKVHALDISPAALAMARANAARHQVSERIIFHEGDGFAALSDGVGFDLIVSNPPYIPSAEIENLQPEVRDHDPRAALDGGADGLDFYRAIAAPAREVLRPAGRLMLEVGDGQAEVVPALLAGVGWGECDLLADLNNVLRIVIAKPAEL